MSSISDLHTPEHTLALQSSGYRGTVTNNPADEEDDLFVKIPELSEAKDFGPCPWTPLPRTDGVLIPTRGDVALVMFTTQNEPWVVGWYPVS